MEEAEKFIASIREMHPNATHNVPLYRVVEEVRSILNIMMMVNRQIQQENRWLKYLNILDVYNVAIVATRYFGGIKLGAGGLIRKFNAKDSKNCSK